MATKGVVYLLYTKRRDSLDLDFAVRQIKVLGQVVVLIGQASVHRGPDLTWARMRSLFVYQVVRHFIAVHRLSSPTVVPLSLQATRSRRLATSKYDRVVGTVLVE